MKKSLLFVFSALLLASVLSACNTTKGAGKDLEKGGQKIQDSAERHGAQ